MTNFVDILKAAAGELIGGGVVAIIAIRYLQKWYDNQRRRERQRHLCTLIADDLYRMARWVFDFERAACIIDPAEEALKGRHASLVGSFEAVENLPRQLHRAAVEMYHAGARLMDTLSKHGVGEADQDIQQLKATIAQAELEMRPYYQIASGEGIKGRTIWEWDDIDLFERPPGDDPWATRGLSRPA